MEIIIRNAEIKDSESITELSNQLGYEAVNAEIQNRLKKILEHPDNCIYVATQNKKVVGWIHGFYSMRVESDFFVEIGGLVVSDNFRKNGIGKKLVDKVIEWADLKNCRKVRVRCNVIRTESHKFYEKIGFEINKEQKIFNKQLN
ncbi:GNAT family N-acetyltransferase [Tenacibaculum caenipelagi]|uniref:Putative N-acetyltransferase YhbS n=1 Tax=Tenacibaculum caenipelagi TaxID=1325435 RepID=A0A4V3D319_9FLAO|nr:GNAT family N-acetyltransferase [Tenacibaculum caenipelagi]TDQ27514.1 putative N-acetyltransferase YhbS [Tenacibaculum caenipelagi]